MKIKNNLIKIMLFITLISLITHSNVYASGLDDVLGQADDFISTGESGTVPISGTALAETSSIIYNTLLGIGMLVAIVVGIFIGIKFMVSTVDEKAKIKEVLVAYVLRMYSSIWCIWNMEISNTNIRKYIKGGMCNE